MCLFAILSLKCGVLSDFLRDFCFLTKPGKNHVLHIFLNPLEKGKILQSERGVKLAATWAVQFTVILELFSLPSPNHH